MRSVTVFSAILMGIAFARVPALAEDPGGEPIVREETISGEQQPDRLDEEQQEWSERVISTATWMDAFFDDELYQSTSNKTYLRIKAGPFIDHRGLTVKTSTDLRLRLPNTERWLFNVGGSPDPGIEDGSTSLEDEEREDAGDNDSNAYMGINTFLRQTRTRNVGTGGGVKISTSRLALYGTFKWIELWPFRGWDLRATQRFRVYSDTGPEFKSQLDADWPLAHRFLFRTSGSILLKYDDPDTFYDFNLTLYQYLTTRRAILYSVNNGFKSTADRPLHLNRTVARVEYRRQWRDWFYTSLIPQVSFQERRDWRADPGIRFDFSMRFGHVEKVEHSSPYLRKQEANKQRDDAERDRALQEGYERIRDWMEGVEDEPDR